ncbi:hypothetical protein BD310DRAFT_886286 [Dichomitus squalens]|uniref:Uncharacterized protein n=1 Tax=Dichomitus squalens TaxID=114155 RepID=A0A4Q9PJU9_9APHY|nr:hypothetical protein BD310DRAFT_886286 [Dichomitus squalens]
MGNDVSRARVLTVSSFLTNFAVQTYGMITTPNMKDVADANHFAFSPSPWFIAAFFSGQVVLQLVWIRQIFANDPPNGYQAIARNPSSTGEAHDESPMQPTADKEEERAWKVALSYAPVYAIGNFCIAGWLFFWLRQNFAASQVLVTINTAVQLLAVAALPPVRPDSPMLHKLTHLVAKTFAGIGVLDFIDNGGVAFRYRPPPSSVVQALTYIFFPVATAYSGPLFGSVLLYDLVAVTVGQMGVQGAGPWPTRLGWTTLTTASIVALKLATQGRQFFRKST